MRSRQLSLLFLLLVVTSSLVACSGSETKDTVQPTLPPTVAATHTPPVAEIAPTPTRELEALSPQELGEEIGGVYLEALQKATELVIDKPAVAEVKAQVAELKETYVQRLVALGHQREALGRLDRAAVDNAINETFIAGSKTDWYNTFFEAVQHYSDEDDEFYQLLYSFNLIGQYARFDLLREQEPDEAARLGLMEATVAEAATPAATTSLAPTSAPETALGDAMRNEPGGYRFQPITGFVVQETGGRVVMNPDGGDPGYGPAVIITGGPNEGHASVEAFYDSLLGDADDSQLSNRREITVGGDPGIAVDVKSSGDGPVEMTSRIVVALGNAGQQELYMAGFAPTEQWPELEPLFEGVVASIRFFDPATASTSTLAATLGEERRSEYGGFVYRPIQGYEVTDEQSMIAISAPDGNPDTGPGILILNLFDEELTDLATLVEALIADTPNLQSSEQRAITVDGVEGVAVDLRGTDQEDRALVVRMVSISPATNQQFVMIGIAPPERWDGELEPLFEKVLASVSFSERD